MNAASFAGRGIALAYYRLWFHLTALRRRVETFQLVDRSLSTRRITYDIDLCTLQEMNLFRRTATSSTEGPDSEERVIIPLARVDKKLFCDVDTETGVGEALHLCRKHVNIRVTAHLIVDLFAASGMKSSADNDIFNLAVQYLFSGSEDLVGELRKIAEINAVRNTFTLISFLRDLQNKYIQCIEISDHRSSNEIVKIRISTTINNISSFSQAKKNRQHQPQEPLVSTTGTGGNSENRKEWIRSDRQENLNVARRRTKRLAFKFFEYIGVLASRIEILDCPIGRGIHPSHMRVVAPSGTLIDDVHIFKVEDPKSPVNHSGLQILFHHERAVVLDEALPRGNYAVRVKLNPKRGNFLIPAALDLFTQVGLLLLCLFLGPDRIARNDVALTGGLLLLPSLAAFFASRDAEHEVLSRILGWPRLFTVSSAISGVFCGTLMAVLPGKLDNIPPSRLTFCLFYGLIISLHLTLGCLFLICLQIGRIEAMRKVVRKRLLATALGVAAPAIRRKERLSYLIIKTTIITIALLLLLAYIYIRGTSIDYLHQIWHINN